MSESYDRYAIVVSDFNEDVTSKLLQGASQRFAEKGVEESALTVIHVPGALELPLIAKLLAKSKKYDAVVCLGSVIRGDTDHYDYVCQQVSAGCMQVTLGTDIPVIFGVLTTNTIEQAFDRVGGKEGHKGKDAADTALAMVKVIKNMGKAIEPNKGVFGFV